MTVTPNDEFDAFYAAHHNRLVSYVAGMSGWADAEDIAHDVLAVLHRRWADIEAPQAYAYRALGNIVTTRWRRRAVEQRLLPRLVGPSTVGPPDEPRDPRYGAAFMLLSDRQRQVLVLRRAADLSHREIAEIVHSTETNVRRMYHDAAARLDSLIHKDRVDGAW